MGRRRRPIPVEGLYLQLKIDLPRGSNPARSEGVFRGERSKKKAGFRCSPVGKAQEPGVIVVLGRATNYFQTNP